MIWAQGCRSLLQLALCKRYQARLSPALRRRMGACRRTHAQGCFHEFRSCGTWIDNCGCIRAKQGCLWRHWLLGKLLGMEFLDQCWRTAYYQRWQLGFRPWRLPQWEIRCSKGRLARLCQCWFPSPSLPLQFTITVMTARKAMPMLVSEW